MIHKYSYKLKQGVICMSKSENTTKQKQSSSQSKKKRHSNFYEINRIRCPVCHRYYLNKDIVYLDISNTIIHQRCYDKERFFPIKHVGTYRKLMEKYPKFEKVW